MRITTVIKMYPALILLPRFPEQRIKSDSGKKIKSISMKQFRLSALFCLSVFSALHADATIWRLNNSNGGALNPPINASFPTVTTLQAAHDHPGVQNGDTIHVEQSTASYGNLIMTKKLVLIGPGYFLDKNPKTQVNKSYGATVGAITMDAASCSGSVLTGLTINGNVNMGANKLILTRNYLINATVYVGGTGSTDVDSQILAQNYMSSSSKTCILERPGTGLITNLVISNNYISTDDYYSYSSIILSGRVSAGLLKNNIINAKINVSNMYILNNIMYSTHTNTCYNSLIEFNLGKTANQFQTPYGSNNTTNSVNNIVNSAQGFVGGTPVSDGSWALQTSSPAKGAGKSGDDMGIFGGPLPYVLSGIPTVPNIYELTIAPVAAGATSISVTVSAKSN